MRSLCLGVLLVALFALSDGNSKHPKVETSVRDRHSTMPKHGEHNKMSPHHLKGHKPVGASPHSVYKDEWMKMSQYKKTKQSDCIRKCHKHQICLVNGSTKKAECISRHNFREGRRLFRKFRNHDVKGIHKAVEDYSRHHQKPAKPAAHHVQHKGKQHKMHRPRGDHGMLKDFPMSRTYQHKGRQHKMPKPQREHRMLKGFPMSRTYQHKGHSSINKHNMLEQHRGNMKHNVHSPHMKHNKHGPSHPASHPTAKHENQRKGVTIKHNHSGSQKPHDAKIELHTKLTPNVVHGHVKAVEDPKADKAMKKRVHVRMSHIGKAVVKKMTPAHHMISKKAHPPMKAGHHMGHKAHPGHKGHKHHGKHRRDMTFQKHHSCSKMDLDTMSKRLTGWFALLHATEEERLQHKIPIQKHDHKCDCQETAVWTLHHLDQDGDNHLNHTELKQLEANRNEPCLKPFIESCDFNLDSILSRKEWCCCFAKTQPPCLEKKQHLEKSHLLGAFKPRCDETGYYEQEQCHESTGYCWCVDLNGNEIQHTRAFGKAHCGKYDVMGNKMHQ